MSIGADVCRPSSLAMFLQVRTVSQYALSGNLTHVVWTADHLYGPCRFRAIVHLWPQVRSSLVGPIKPNKLRIEPAESCFKVSLNH